MRGPGTLKALALIFLLALAACAIKSSEKFNISQVRLGTTESELIEIMGRPTLTKQNLDTSTKMMFDQTWVWSNPYAISGARVVSFGLKDGKVSQLPNLAAID